MKLHSKQAGKKPKATKKDSIMRLHTLHVKGTPKRAMESSHVKFDDQEEDESIVSNKNPNKLNMKLIRQLTFNSPKMVMDKQESVKTGFGVQSKMSDLKSYFSKKAMVSEHDSLTNVSQEEDKKE